MQTCMQTFKQTNKKNPINLSRKETKQYNSWNQILNLKIFHLPKKKTLFNPVQDIHFIETKTRGKQKNFPAKDCKQEKKKKKGISQKMLTREREISSE